MDELGLRQLKLLGFSKLWFHFHFGFTSVLREDRKQNVAPGVKCLFQPVTWLLLWATVMVALKVLYSGSYDNWRIGSLNPAPSQ